MRRIFGFLVLASFWSVMAWAQAPAKPKAPAESKVLLSKGKAAYEMNCIACHGVKGEGDGVAAAAMNPKPRNFAKETFKYGSSVEEIFVTITNGVKDTSMVSFQHVPEDDRWGVAYYVKSMLPKATKKDGKKGK